MPDSSWLTPPMARTGFAPSTAKRTSSIIWPAFSSCTSTSLHASLRATAPSASLGNGQRVTGRNVPMRCPSARSSSTT